MWLELEGKTMRTKAFKQFLTQITKLTPTQKKQALNYFQETCNIEIVEELLNSTDNCPHCGSAEFIKWGMNANIQRYKCKVCQKTFNTLTKTPMARLRHKEKWNYFAEDLVDGKSVKDSAKHCQVAETTSFRWRHRFLQTPSKIKAKHLHGIVEFDETYFLKSGKGNHHLDRKPHKRGGWAKQGLSLKEYTPVLIVRDRNGNMTDEILEHSYDGSIAEVMLPILDYDVLLCSDSKSSYSSFARMFDFAHETINASSGEHVVNGIYHIQNVNAYDSRLKNWMKRFHGVSTKYLGSYLGWMRMLDRESNLTPKNLLELSVGKN